MPNRLKELMEENRITMRELAIKLNTYDATVSRLANGQQTMTEQFAIQFADFFNVTLDYFLCRSDSKMAYEKVVIREKEHTFKDTLYALSTYSNEELLRLSGTIDYILEERRKKQKSDLHPAKEKLLPVGKPDAN